MKFLVLHLAFFTISTSLFSQCTVQSANGYSITASICPTGIVVSSTNCPNGYNYNVQFNYTITVNGTIPGGNLYTLQTNIRCNVNQENGFFNLPKTGGAGSALTTTNPFINNDGAAYLYVTHPSCVAANTVSLQCNSLTLTIQGPGIPSQVVSCSCQNLALPVEFGEMHVISGKNGNTILWTTQTELNNDYFTILSSTDGIHWEEKGNVKSKGDAVSIQSYEFTDENAQLGRTYYKLTQKDNDGRVNELALGDALQLSENVELFPNPAKPTTVNTFFQRESKADVHLSFYTLQGELAYEIDLPATGNQDGLAIFQHAMPVSISNGTYFIQFTQEGELFHSEQLIIQE